MSSNETIDKVIIRLEDERDALRDQCAEIADAIENLNAAIATLENI